MIPLSSISSRFVPGRAPMNGRVPFGFAFRAKLKIWWQTGFPIRLGISEPGALGSITGIGDLEGAFFGVTIWINRAVFYSLHGPEIAEWIIDHEILHAKIAIRRVQINSWIGRHRYSILCNAAADALDLAYHDPVLAELAEILSKYSETEYDAGEEALVRIVQMILAGYDLPQSSALKKAVKLLGRPWGRNPVYLLRIALSLPICIWTARSPSHP
jgi:hypothetical protein